MRCRLPVLFIICTAIVLASAGCGSTPGEIYISPEPVGQNLGLGPGVRPLSFGLGDKSSPRWSPSGKQLAFVLDGYVVDKPVESRELQRLTTIDFGARKIEWLPSGKELAILGHSVSQREKSDAYRTKSGEEVLGVDEISPDVLAMEPRPGGKGLILAKKSGPSASKIATTNSEGQIEKTSSGRLEGWVTGLSTSSDGNSAVLAVKLAENPISFALYKFTGGRFERLTQLPEGMEVIGSPQWTTRGIYYVAGKTPSKSDVPALYDLYQLPEGSETPSLVSSVGEDFVASSVLASPDREMLAIVGRRRPVSQSNLYVLDLQTSKLKALTANENMEIKTGPEDLAWSPDGSNVAIVARGALLSGPKTYAAPADSLLKDFYNVYEVSLFNTESGG